LILAVLPATGCLFRTRRVEDQYSKVALKETTQQGLIDSINQQAEAMQSLKATVDIDSSSGGMKKGHETQYKEIRGYVLAKKPDSLHMIGLMPFVRTTAFDMVSDGKEFRLWIPPKNKFVIGENKVKTPNADQPMESIRPQNIYEALLIRRIDPDNEIAVMEHGYETMHDSKGHRILQDDYEVTVIHKYEAAPAIYLRRGCEGGDRCALRGIQRFQWIQLPVAGGDLPAAGGVRHHPEHAEGGNQCATER
jgi:hypothetical protein